MIFVSLPTDTADKLRLDEHRTVGQESLRVLQPGRAAGQLPGAGNGRGDTQTRLEVRLHRRRRGRLRRKGKRATSYFALYTYTYILYMYTFQRTSWRSYFPCARVGSEYIRGMYRACSKDFYCGKSVYGPWFSMVRAFGLKCVRVLIVRLGSGIFFFLFFTVKYRIFILVRSRSFENGKRFELLSFFFLSAKRNPLFCILDIEKKQASEIVNHFLYVLSIRCWNNVIFLIEIKWEK